MVGFQQNFAKVLQNLPSRLQLAWYFLKYQKSTQKTLNMEVVTVKFHWIHSKFLAFKVPQQRKFKVLLCIYVSFPRVEIQNQCIATYFNTFKPKTHNKI